MEELIRGLLSDYGWLIITALITFLFQKFIRNFVTGLMFLFGNTYNVDDIVYINDKKCRIVRQTIFHTIFHLIEEKRKMVVPNERLNNLNIEKTLP